MVYISGPGKEQKNRPLPNLPLAGEENSLCAVFNLNHIAVLNNIFFTFGSD